jgi:hypothetical protein
VPGENILPRFKFYVGSPGEWQITEVVAGMGVRDNLSTGLVPCPEKEAVVYCWAGKARSAPELLIIGPGCR